MPRPHFPVSAEAWLIGTKIGCSSLMVKCSYFRLGSLATLRVVSRPLHLKFPVVSVLRAGVGSAIFAICDHKIFPANDALPGFWGPLRALFAIAHYPFFPICQIVLLSMQPPILPEMLRRACLGALPIIKFLPADYALSNDGALTLALLRKDFF